MNGTCQYHTTCGNLATTTVRFFGRDYRLCRTCEPQLQADVAALGKAARQAADQVTGLLAGHFGISIQQAAPAAQALVSQRASNAMTNIRRQGARQPRPLPAHGPAPSADHPHPADWACDDLCRPAAPAALPAPPPATQSTARQVSSPPSPPVQGPGRHPRPGKSGKSKLPGGHKFLIGVVAWLSCSVTGIVLAAHHNHGGFALIILAVLTLFAAIAAGIGAIIADGVDQHERWIKQHTPEQQAAIRKAERAAAWGATAVAAVALHEHNKRVGEKLSASVIGTGPKPGAVGAAMFEMKQRRQAGQRHQELLHAIRTSGQRAGLCSMAGCGE